MALVGGPGACARASQGPHRAPGEVYISSYEALKGRLGDGFWQHLSAGLGAEARPWPLDGGPYLAPRRPFGARRLVTAPWIRSAHGTGGAAASVLEASLSCSFDLERAILIHFEPFSTLSDDVFMDFLACFERSHERTRPSRPCANSVAHNASTTPPRLGSRHLNLSSYA